MTLYLALFSVDTTSVLCSVFNPHPRC